MVTHVVLIPGVATERVGTRFRRHTQLRQQRFAGVGVIPFHFQLNIHFAVHRDITDVRQELVHVVLFDWDTDFKARLRGRS